VVERVGTYILVERADEEGEATASSGRGGGVVMGKTGK
jgi:hypothetical protein